MAQLLQEIEFCKSQIKKYSELYESLLVRYNALMDSQVPLNMSFKPNVFKTKHIVSHESESESDDDSESSSDEFTKAVSNYITNGANKKLNIDAPSQVRKPESSKKNNKEMPDFLLDDIESFVQPESNKKQIQLKSKEDEEDFKRLEKRNMMLVLV